MNVRDAIAQLSQMDPDAIVILAKDPEGNAFNPLDELSTAIYGPATREIGLFELTDDLRAKGYDEDDLLDGIPSVVLWPS